MRSAVVFVVFLCVFLTSLSSSAADLNGIWGYKLGEISLIEKDGHITGRLQKSTEICPFKKGQLVLEGDLFDDTVIGQILMPQSGTDCGGAVKAHALLLIGEKGKLLSGSANAKDAKCPLVGFSGDKGIIFRKLKDVSAKELAKAQQNAPILPGPPAAPGTYDPRAAIKSQSPIQKLLIEAKGKLDIGNFEEARRTFKKILKKDAKNATAQYGIGVTHYGRQEYSKAMQHYKKALELDPNLGIVYYNMACLYALEGKPQMALQYLKISVMNGFASHETMEKDPDLKSLRNLPTYQNILKGEF